MKTPLTCNEYPLLGAGLVALFLVTTLCVTASARAQTPNLEGIWSGTLTHPYDPGWTIEDIYCFVGCPVPTYEYMRRLLEDPRNDDRPYAELRPYADRFTVENLHALMTPEGQELLAAFDIADEPGLRCEHFGFFRETLSPLPVRITQYEDRVTFQYENYGIFRTVYTDGRDAPRGLPTLYGYSEGRYEDSMLVIETSGVTPNYFFAQSGGGQHSDELRTTERYSVSDDGTRLELFFIVEDSVMLRAPWVWRKLWLSIPGVEILDHDCHTISGQPGLLERGK